MVDVGVPPRSNLFAVDVELLRTYILYVYEDPTDIPDVAIILPLTNATSVSSVLWK